VITGQRAAEQSNGALTNFDGYTILRDDRESNPDRRYKMVAHWESVHYWDNHSVSGSLGRSQEFIDRCAAARGEYITYSGDGLRWEQPLERLVTLQLTRIVHRALQRCPTTAFTCARRPVVTAHCCD
jgi:hypothetical protein